MPPPMSWREQRARSGGKRLARLLPRSSNHSAGTRWQLEHGRALPQKQPGDQHDLAVGKLERVVMRKRPVHVDLTETSQALAHESEPQAWHQTIKAMFVLGLPFERDLGARKKAHCHVSLADSGEAAGA